MNNTGANQPAHRSRLISAFVIRFSESIICKLASGENFNFLAYLCSRGDWFETRFVGNPEDRFSHDEAYMFIRFIVESHKFELLGTRDFILKYGNFEL